MFNICRTRSRKTSKKKEIITRRPHFQHITNNERAAGYSRISESQWLNCSIITCSKYHEHWTNCVKIIDFNCNCCQCLNWAGFNQNCICFEIEIDILSFHYQIYGESFEKWLHGNNPLTRHGPWHITYKYVTHHFCMCNSKLNSQRIIFIFVHSTSLH